MNVPTVRLITDPLGRVWAAVETFSGVKYPVTYERPDGELFTRYLESIIWQLVGPDDAVEAWGELRRSASYMAGIAAAKRAAQRRWKGLASGKKVSAIQKRSKTG